MKNTTQKTTSIICKKDDLGRVVYQKLAEYHEKWYTYFEDGEVFTKDRWDLGDRVREISRILNKNGKETYREISFKEADSVYTIEIRKLYKGDHLIIQTNQHSDGYRRSYFFDDMGNRIRSNDNRGRVWDYSKSILPLKN